MDTVKSLNENFNKLQEGYNQRQTKYPDVSMYAQKVQEEKIQSHLESGVKLYKPQFEDLLHKVVALIVTNVMEKNMLKFPLKYSSISNERLLGEQKITNAWLLFNQFKENPHLLLDTIQSMVSMNELDSANSLLDVISLNIGNSENEDYVQLLALREHLSKRLGINEIALELNELQLLKDRIQKVISMLSAGIPYILFDFQTSQMQDQEFFDLQNKLTGLFGEPTFNKIQSFSMSN